MFGYVTICEPELKMKDFRRYKAYYCGLCQTLKERHGSMGQMTLTYDMTFAIVLLTSLYEKAPRAVTHRCKVHPVKKQNMLQNEFSEYAADMNLLLAYYHLVDDWQDEKKLSALAGMNVLHKKAEKIIQKYPRQSRAIKRELRKLAQYEAENSQDLDATAGCFGRLMEEVLVYQQDVWENTLREIGFFLGKYIYIMDAYEDLEVDLKEGNYNPLKDMSKSEGYEEKCREILCMMVAESSAAFEKLPCLLDADILRNILYAGVWTKYNRIQKKKEDKSGVEENGRRNNKEASSEKSENDRKIDNTDKCRRNGVIKNVIKKTSENKTAKDKD